MNEQTLQDISISVRRDIIRVSSAAGSGHPTSSLSAVELGVTIFANYFRYNPANPHYWMNDRVIFSKGHASPLYYSLYKAAGLITEEEFLTYRQFTSRLEGHPTPQFPYAEAATGSLGQGLAVGVGEALAIKKHLEEKKGRVSKEATDPNVYVLLGDGEMAEGSVWEASSLPVALHLDNLVAIVDVNGLGQSGKTLFEDDTDVYKRRLEAFGWAAKVINGHSVSEVISAVNDAHATKDRPFAIIAKTIKGKGVSFLEGKEGWHGKTLNPDETEIALSEIGEAKETKTFSFASPEGGDDTFVRTNGPSEKELPSYDAAIATRKAFGDALERLAHEDMQVIAIDGDTKNSTYSEIVAKSLPNQFLECYIAEQTMVGVALGLSKVGKYPVVSTFAAFLTRAFDQFRMATLSDGSMLVNGSHAGVSIGADGGSQMGLEDLSMFRSLFGSTVVYPSDPYQTHALVFELRNVSGITYLRTTRESTPVLYTKDDTFPIGGSKTHPSGIEDRVTVFAAGITLHEALKAQKLLKEEGIGIRVVDSYSVKPMDMKAIESAVKETKGIVVVEDHYPQGGIGEAVSHGMALTKASLPFVHLAVHKKTQSGKPEELLAFQEIDAKAIVEAVKSMNF